MLSTPYPCSGCAMIQRLLEAVPCDSHINARSPKSPHISGTDQHDGPEHQAAMLSTQAEPGKENNVLGMCRRQNGRDPGGKGEKDGDKL